MKTFKIRKNTEFSLNSKVMLHAGSEQIHIKGFRPLTFHIGPDEEFYASQLWTQSNRIKYDQLNDNTVFVIRPRLGKVFAFVVLMVFSVCAIIFIFFRWRWSVVPLFPFVIYIGLYLTILKNRYLIIVEDKDHEYY